MTMTARLIEGGVTTPAHRPPDCSRWSRETTTGAATARFVVKTAAAGTGPRVDAIRHKSSGCVTGFGFLIPQ